MYILTILTILPIRYIKTKEVTISVSKWIRKNIIQLIELK